MKDTKVVVQNGFGLGSACLLLTIAFIILKVIGTINWSWWLVLLPLWGYAALTIVVLVIILIIVGIAAYLGDK